MLVKVGIIGPKPFSLGSHDKEEGLRLYIRGKIKERLKALQTEGPVLGLTGLALGAESDFCEMCLDLGIDYNVYLPYEEMDAAWQNLPGVAATYQKLLASALNIQLLSEGNFSPRKIAQKNQHIIKTADIVFYVPSSLKSNCLNLEIAHKLNKRVIIIE